MIMSLTWRRHCNPCFKPEFPETPSQLWGDGPRVPVVPGTPLPRRHPKTPQAPIALATTATRQQPVVPGRVPFSHRISPSLFLSRSSPYDTMQNLFMALVDLFFPFPFD